jgi:hypothetical protein
MFWFWLSYSVVWLWASFLSCLSVREGNTVITTLLGLLWQFTNKDGSYHYYYSLLVYCCYFYHLHLWSLYYSSIRWRNITSGYSFRHLFLWFPPDKKSMINHSGRVFSQEGPPGMAIPTRCLPCGVTDTLWAKVDQHANAFEGAGPWHKRGECTPFIAEIEPPFGEGEGGCYVINTVLSTSCSLSSLYPSVEQVLSSLVYTWGTVFRSVMELA